MDAAVVSKGLFEVTGWYQISLGWFWCYVAPVCFFSGSLVVLERIIRTVMVLFSISVVLQGFLNSSPVVFCAVRVVQRSTFSGPSVVNCSWYCRPTRVLIRPSKERFAKLTSVVHIQVQSALRCHNTFTTRSCWQTDEMNKTFCAIPLKCQECESHSRGWLAYRHPPPPTAKQLVLSVILMQASCQQLLLVGRDSGGPCNATTMFSMLSARIKALSSRKTPSVKD